MYPYLCTHKKNTLALKRTLPNKEIQIKQLSLLYHHFERHLTKVFISVPEVSVDTPCGKRIPAAHTSPRSYHWFAMTEAWSHSLRGLVGTCCACLHYTTSLTVLVIPPILL